MSSGTVTPTVTSTPLSVFTWRFIVSAGALASMWR